MTIHAQKAVSSALVTEVTSWRHHIHEHPELLYETERTAAFVAEKLESFGCDLVVSGVGRSGVVGVVKGAHTDTGRIVGLRADMDALPIVELSDVPYTSRIAGRMHACGHDGHTAVLLGAAKFLAQERAFAGQVVLVFEPAEEGGAGAKAMLDDGLVARFGIQEIYGMHNLPGMPLGHFAVRPGPIMAASDRFTISIVGNGGHAGAPNRATDSLLAAAHVITAAQSIVARNVDPLESAVLSITSCHGGEAFNVIPDRVELNGSLRYLEPSTGELCKARLANLVQSIAASFGAEGFLDYRDGYPVTVNHQEQAIKSANIAANVFGADRVNLNYPTIMGAEDFSFMLRALPGAFIFYGNGDSAGLHNPRYDFNDLALAPAMTFLVNLVHETLSGN